MQQQQPDIYQLQKPLNDDNCPNISVLTPCYQRHDFLPLMIQNLKAMDYPHDKIIWEILQDGPDCLFQGLLEDVMKTLHPIQIKYCHEPNVRRTIGKKRDILSKNSTHKIMINMDSDDIYLPTYFRYAVSCLKESKAGIVGSSGMMFIFPEDNLKTSSVLCPAKRQIHEATFCYTKKYFRSIQGYNTGEKPGEGAHMVDFAENRCKNINIMRIMVCVCHGENTVDKDRFKDNPCEIPQLVRGWIDPHVRILQNIITMQEVVANGGRVDDIIQEQEDDTIICKAP